MLEAQKETFFVVPCKMDDGWFGTTKPGGGTLVTELVLMVPVVRSGCTGRTGARMQAAR